MHVSGPEGTTVGPFNFARNWIAPTMAYLEKGMTGFHEYTPQRPHTEIRVGRKICAM